MSDESSEFPPTFYCGMCGHTRPLDLSEIKPQYCEACADRSNGTMKVRMEIKYPSTSGLKSPSRLFQYITRHGR